MWIYIAFYKKVKTIIFIPNLLTRSNIYSQFLVSQTLKGPMKMFGIARVKGIEIGLKQNVLFKRYIRWILSHMIYPW